MATFQIPKLSLDESPIPARTLAYFRRRLQLHLHELVIGEFDKRGITKAGLAGRLSKDRSQITRWLGAPGNWTLDTFSDLMVGMGIDPRCAVVPLAELPEEEKESKPNEEGARGVEYQVRAIPKWLVEPCDSPQEDTPSPQRKAPPLRVVGPRPLAA